MDKHVTWILIILLLPWSLLLLSAVEALGADTSPLYEQVLGKLESLTPGETIEVRMGTEKERYDTGELLEIRFWASKDSYITLMALSTDGNITFLAPSRQVPDTKIEGGKVYSTGSPSGPVSAEETLYDLSMKITVMPPNGTETINLFCSPAKIDLFEADFDKEPFYMITPANEERLKTLLDRLDQLEQFEWSGTSIKILIGPEPTPMPMPGLKKGMPRKPGLPPVPESAKMIPRKFGALPPIGATGTTGKFFPPIGSTGTTGKTDKIDAP